MPSLYTTQEQIRTQIENDLKASGLFTKHNFLSKLSRTNTLIRSFALSVLLFVDVHILRIFKAIHPHSAIEEDLHNWLKRYGLEWKQATKARHNLRIGSVEVPTTTVPIPQGLVVLTPGEEIEQVRFQILEASQITPDTPLDSEGKYTVAVVVEAFEDGPIGNVVQNSITEIENPPSGITVCYNPDTNPLLAGSDRENIESVRNRISNYENSLGSKWTPDWYVSECEQFAFVRRCIFVSSKNLNMPGHVKLLLVGASYLPISTENLELVEEYFNSEDSNPGGSAIVLTENATMQPINRTIVAYFADADSVLPEEDLLGIIEEYFGSLNSGDDFKESGMRFLFYNLPRLVQVVITPSGDVSIPDGTIAVPGVITVSGEVYSP